MTFPRPGGRSPDRVRWRTVAIFVFVVGTLVRLFEVLHGAGLGSDLGYDPGVYFAAADGLTHGRLPYRDFVLLHPPGLMLAVTPFAFATRFVSDHVAFVAANLTFTALGAFNSAFVVLIGRKLGLSLAAAASGGLFAALWLGSVHAEDMVRLEPLANLFVLVALYAYAVARHRPSSRAFLVIGVASGLAASVKIWYVVPLVVLLGWVLVGVRSRRATVLAVSGTAAAMIATNGVFFFLAPRAMWAMVVTEQLGRRRSTPSPLTRFGQVDDMVTWHRALGFGPMVLSVAVLVLGATLLLWGAWRQPSGRMLVLLVAAQAVVMAAAPSWWAFYADYLTPALAVALSVGVDGVRSAPGTRRLSLRLPQAVAPGTAVAVAVVLAVLVTPLCWQHAGEAFPRFRLSALRTSRCVVSDSPTALIELDALSRSFSTGCRNWVDVVGRTYGVDRGAFRAENPAWQRDLKAYLLSGDAFILTRPSTGLSAQTRAALTRSPVIAQAGSYVIFRGRSARR